MELELGVVVGLIGLLGVVAVYFWIVRRAQNEAVQEPQKQ